MRVLPLLCALVLGVACALITGCGDRSHLLPPPDAQGLKEQLSAVEQAVATGQCTDKDAALARARSVVDKLPSKVDKRLTTRLRSGLSKLAKVADHECAHPPTTTTAVPTTTTTTPVKPTVPTDTTPTQPTTPTDTTPQSTPVKPTTPTTPTDPSGGAGTDTGTAPAPDPGGAPPGGKAAGPGLRAAPRNERTARDQPEAAGYRP